MSLQQSAPLNTPFTQPDPKSDPAPPRAKAPQTRKASTVRSLLRI